MTELSNLIIKNSIKAVMLQTERQPSPYLFEKWEYEPGLEGGVSRTCVRVAGGTTLFMGADRTRIAHSDFFEVARFGKFCNRLTDAMALDGYDVETIAQVWLPDDKAWGFIITVQN